MTTEPLDVESLLAAAPPIWTGLPAGTTIGHIHLFVRDLEAAAAFYHDALGLDKVVWSYPGALFLAAGGYHHHLGINTWAAGAPLAAEDDARLLEWTLRLPDAHDVARAAASLESAGFVVPTAGDSRVAADPWGTRVRLTT
jgi:catechol 2,3-dioxygenase